MKSFYKLSLVLVVLLSACDKIQLYWNLPENPGSGTFIDPRDYAEYKFIKIGEQIWMAENLRYLPVISSCGNYEGSSSDPNYFVNGYTFSDISIFTNVSGAKKSNEYITYGVLYNWEAAMSACPPGWHLPTDDEWKKLEQYLGMTYIDAEKTGEWRISGNVDNIIKSQSGWGLYDNYNGIDSVGFNALPGGWRDNTGCGHLKQAAYFWTSTPDETSNAYFREIWYQGNGILRDLTSKENGLSIRCVKD